MYDLEDVHQTAEKFLREYQRNMNYKAEKLEVNQSLELPLPEFVVLKQTMTPPYFYGFKPSGRPVFTHDLRLAKSFKTDCITIGPHIDRLKSVGVKVEQHPTTWYEGKPFAF